MGRGMAGGGGRAVGAVAVPCEVTAMVCGAAVGVVSSVKAWCSELCVGTTGFGGQFDPEDVLLPPPTHIPIDAELKGLHVGTLHFWLKVIFEGVI